MTGLSKMVDQDAVIVKRRFDKHLYAINPKTYADLQDTLRMYHESMYLLPDFEQVEAVGADQENEKKRFQNE